MEKELSYEVTEYEIWKAQAVRNSSLQASPCNFFVENNFEVEEGMAGASHSICCEIYFLKDQ
jgi:hypothetical protein